MRNACRNEISFKIPKKMRPFQKSFALLYYSVNEPVSLARLVFIRDFQLSELKDNIANQIANDEFNRK